VALGALADIERLAARLLIAAGRGRRRPLRSKYDESRTPTEEGYECDVAKCVHGSCSTSINRGYEPAEVKLNVNT
jgi:hypothetical protein